MLGKHSEPGLHPQLLILSFLEGFVYVMWYILGKKKLVFIFLKVLLVKLSWNPSKHLVMAQKSLTALGLTMYDLVCSLHTRLASYTNHSVYLSCECHAYWLSQ